LRLFSIGGYGLALAAVMNFNNFTADVLKKVFLYQSAERTMGGKFG